MTADKSGRLTVLDQAGADLAMVESALVHLYRSIRVGLELPGWPGPLRPLEEPCRAMTLYGPNGKLTTPRPCQMPGSYAGGFCHIHFRQQWFKRRA